VRNIVIFGLLMIFGCAEESPSSDAVSPVIPAPGEVNDSGGVEEDADQTGEMDAEDDVSVVEDDTEWGENVDISAPEDVQEAMDSEEQAQEDASLPDGEDVVGGDDSQEGDVEESDAAEGEEGGESPDGEEEDTQVTYPPNPSIKLNHLQGLGTHNSYHKKPTFADIIYQWDYEHLPLDEQMGKQGIRQFELDVYYDESNGTFDVYHIAVIDQEVTCGSIVECIQVIKNWSDAHLAHHPFVVLVELKTDFSDSLAMEILDNLDAALLSVWPVDRLVTPDLVQGEYDSVRDAIAEEGWPSIDDVRGRGLFVLHAGGEYAGAYTEGGTTTEGRVMFPDAYGNLDHAYAAVHSMNDPIGGLESIQNVVSAGHIVRTRSDSNSDEPNAGDYSRYEAALESGAHFISTDYPGEPYGAEWAVNIPGGTPSRCNPISALEDCFSEGVEQGQLEP